MSFKKMVIAAIYNVFDGEELLEHSIDQIRDEVDIIICVVQEYSNYGQYYQGGYNKCFQLLCNHKINLIQKFKPNSSLTPQQNENEKRNIGINRARERGATHFMLMDCDEFWTDIPEPDCAHRMYTYFKHPTLRYETMESYYVPGLMTLKNNTKVGAYNCGFYCDPTRKPNHKLKEGKEIMHHFSYVRKDINRKIENSTAKSNIFAKKDKLFTDLEKACDGYSMTFVPNRLVEVENIFGIDYTY